MYVTISFYAKHKKATWICTTLQPTDEQIIFLTRKSNESEFVLNLSQFSWLEVGEHETPWKMFMYNLSSECYDLRWVKLNFFQAKMLWTR